MKTFTWQISVKVSFSLLKYGQFLMIISLNLLGVLSCKYFWQLDISIEKVRICLISCCIDKQYIYIWHCLFWYSYHSYEKIWWFTFKTLSASITFWHLRKLKQAQLVKLPLRLHCEYCDSFSIRSSDLAELADLEDLLLLGVCLHVERKKLR